VGKAVFNGVKCDGAIRWFGETAMRGRLWILVVVIATWHLCCLAAMFAYSPTADHVVEIACSWRFDNSRADCGQCERVGAYVALFTVTAPATAASLALVSRLTHCRYGWERSAVAFAGWETAVVWVLVWSYEVGFPNMVHQLSGAMFGPAEDVFSFRNLLLHRLIAWIVCTTPPALVALWLYIGLPRQNHPVLTS
jgi:hypothetical protein